MSEMFLHAISISLKWPILTFSHLLEKQHISTSALELNYKFEFVANKQCMDIIFLFTSRFQHLYFGTEPSFRPNLLFGEPPSRVYCTSFCLPLDTGHSSWHSSWRSSIIHALFRSFEAKDSRLTVWLRCDGGALERRSISSNRLV